MLRRRYPDACGHRRRARQRRDYSVSKPAIDRGCSPSSLTCSLAKGLHDAAGSTLATTKRGITHIRSLLSMTRWIDTDH